MTFSRGQALARALLLAALAAPAARAGDVDATPVCFHKSRTTACAPPRACCSPCDPCCQKVGPVRSFFRRVFRKDCCPPVAVAVPVVVAPPACPPPVVVAPRPVAPVYVPPPGAIAAPPAAIAPPSAVPPAPFVPGSNSSLRREAPAYSPAPPVRFERIASRQGETPAPTVRAKAESAGYDVVLVHATHQHVRRQTRSTADGWFAIDLTPGVWYVYYRGEQGGVYRGKVEVTRTQLLRARL